MTLEARALQAVSDLRQRFKDPNFKKLFVSTIMAAITEQQEACFVESNTNAAAYGDTNDTNLSTELHSIRGEVVRSILNLLVSLGDVGKDEAHERALSSVDQIRYILGHLLRNAYQQAQLEPPLLLQDGGLGVYYEGVGTVVVWERVRDFESQINGISDCMKPPEEPPQV